MTWKFDDAENLAVITITQVMNGEERIAAVFHNADDGGWQCLSSGVFLEADSSVVSLGEIVFLEPGIVELSDLPLGWHASRKSTTSPWIRSKT